MSTACDTCGKTYQSGVQPDLFTGKKECLECLTKTRIAVMLSVLPQNHVEADDHAWAKLTGWEKTFVLTVNQRFKQKGTLSDHQCRLLEGIYEKRK